MFWSLIYQISDRTGSSDYNQA